MTGTTNPTPTRVPPQPPPPDVEECCEADLIRCPQSGCDFVAGAPGHVAGSALDAYQKLLAHMLERYDLTEQQVYLEVRDVVWPDGRPE